MSVTWPSSLPQAFLIDDYKDQEPALFTKTEMDAGPPKLRRRFTAAQRPFSGSMVLTATQKATLRTFYQTYGAGEISFPDQDGESSDLTVIFMAEPVYSRYELVWKVDLQFAEMPS